MNPPNPELRRQVIAIYKRAQCQQCLKSIPGLTSSELLFMGKEYPLGYDYFRLRLHRAFMANASLRDEDAIRKGIERAEYVKKGEIPFTRKAVRNTSGDLNISFAARNRGFVSCQSMA